MQSCSNWLFRKYIHSILWKSGHIYIFWVTIKNKPIWIIFHTHNPEEILCKCFWICPPHLKKYHHWTLWNAENIINSRSNWTCSEQEIVFIFTNEKLFTAAMLWSNRIIWYTQQWQPKIVISALTHSYARIPSNF